MSKQSDSIFLQIYDIIKINSPSNDLYHDKQFLIEYIDNIKLKIINVTSNDEYTLLLNPDKSLQDESIESITLISRDTNDGYAKQNNLLPNTWINIHFGGEFPSIVTGQITNLEEDMIEVKLYESDDVIYIDFAYKGIPEELFIEQIEIRQEPSTVKSKDKTPEEKITDEESESEPTPIDDENEQEQYEVYGVTPTPDFSEEVDKSIVESQEPIFGEALGEVSIMKNVDKSKQRFSIETQQNSLLDELLSDIPTHKRNANVMNNLNQMIERFVQLRNLFSEFDEYGNALMPKKKGATHRPLIKYLLHFDKQIKNVSPIIEINNSFYNEHENTEDLHLLNEIFENYKRNNTPSDNNKYKYFLRSIDSFLKPYELTNSSSVLTTLDINKDIDMIIQNIVSDDFEDTFETQKQNVDPVMSNQRFLHGEPIQPRSIMIFSKPIIENFKQFLPETSILKRSLLNNVEYFDKLSVGKTKKIIIDNIDELFDYTSVTKFLKNNLHISVNETIDEINIYEKFLNAIIPKTRKLFDYTNQYNNGNLSLQSLVNELEPFLIYTDDITYMLYDEMTNFLDEKILEYKKNYKEKLKIFRNLSSKKISSEKTPFIPMLELLKDSHHPETKADLLDEVIYQTYFPNADYLKTKSNSEILKTIYSLDKGRLLCSAIVLSNINLLETVNIQDELDKGNEQYGEFIEKEKKDDNCETLTLAKKYIELDELLEDNDKTIYYDKQYDPTQYDIIDEYNDEMTSYDPEEFKLFLAKKIQENIGLSEEKAELEANSMINKKRIVQDNDYAILEEEGKNKKYYKRVLNKWILNESYDGMNINDNMFCNLKEKCFSFNDKCMNLKVTESEMKKQSLENLLKEFDLSHELSIEDLTHILISNYAYYKNQIQQIKQINQSNNYKYNNQRYELGIEFSKDETVRVQSPYLQKLELILGQPDFIKKQCDIILFKQRFTREPNEDESQYWLYCIKTDTKLLPSFLYALAITFNTGGDYIAELEKIKKERGKQSDDQGYWVDKHSGRKITNIDFSDEEGRTEAGYKVSTNDLLEEEQKISLDEIENLQDMIEDPIALTVYKILNALTNYMYINIEEHYVSIIQNVLNLYTRKIVPEEDHKKREEKAAKKGKKIKSYEDIKNYLLIVITASYLHVFVQTAIPSIKTNKTFPGCIKSFDGYPLEKTSNLDGIIYVSCIILKIKNKSVSPWNSISGIKNDALVQTIRDLIESDILKDVAVERMITKKMEYITSGGINVDIPLEHDVSNWSTFLPPLVEFKVKSLNPVSSSFINSLVDKMKSGTEGQDDDILILQSKNIVFTYQIIEKINKVVKSEIPQLRTNSDIAFLENTCCIENEITTPLQYFIGKDNSIQKDVETVDDYIKVITDTHEIPLAPYYLYDTNTKLKFPGIANTFSESLIYSYFIKLCNFNNDIPLSEDLEKIGIFKPDKFPKNQPLSEQITFLKQQNINYNESHMNHLMRIINKHNSIKKSIENQPISRIQKIRDMMVYLNDIEDDNIPSQLKKLLTDLLDTFEIGVKTETPEIEAIKNYLSSENNKMKTTISQFFISHGKMTSKELSPVIEFINESTDWQLLRENGDMKFNNIEHDSVYRILDFILDCINNMCYVYPNIILRKTEYDKIKINKYWKFSDDHNSDIKNMIMKYYSFLPQFYDENFDQLLLDVQEKCKNIFILCTIIPCFSPIDIPSSDKKVLSIFDKVTCSFLYEFCMLKIYSYFINNTNTVGYEKFVEKRFSDITTDGEIDDLRTGNYGDEDDIVSGERLEKSEKVAKLLIEFTKRFISNKSNINLSYEDIMKKVNRSSEREKSDKTTRLKEFTDEQREVNKLFKKHKLGEWGKGLQKGLTQYVKETYDEERSEILNRQTNIEENLHINKFNMNDYFIDEAAQQFITGDEIEREEYSLDHLPEDDDHGENDGDEGF